MTRKKRAPTPNREDRRSENPRLHSQFLTVQGLCKLGRAGLTVNLRPLDGSIPALLPSVLGCRGYEKSVDRLGS